MKTNYSELLARATSLPYSVQNNWHYQTIRTSAGAIIASNESSDFQDERDSANAELLAHSTNVLPQALAALKMIEKRFAENEKDYEEDVEYQALMKAIAEIESVNL